MRSYEALIVLNMKGQTSSVSELTKAIGEEITSEGATIQKTADLGRREFAYESRHTKAGQYVSYAITAEPATIRKIRERLSINPVVHLQYYKLNA